MSDEYSRVLLGLLVKVVYISLVDLEEARGVMTAAVESQIELLWDLAPSSLIPLGRDSGIIPPNFVVRSEPEGHMHQSHHYHVVGHGIRGDMGFQTLLT